MKKFVIFCCSVIAVSLCFFLVLVLYPGNLSGIKYDIEGYRLRRLAERGNVYAQRELGSHYDWHPDETKTDPEKAVFWLGKAAEQGDAFSQHLLAVHYASGNGVNKDLRQAAHWYRQAAEQGFSAAQIKLAGLYARGEIAEDNSRRAGLFGIGAEYGNSDCQYQLALCYRDGSGVKKDLKQAAKWFRKGADQGSSDCQYLLGCCYAKGEGVVRDLDQAERWYREAAEQGHESAKKALFDLKKQ